MRQLFCNYNYFLNSFPKIKSIKNTIIFAVTIVGPMGVPASIAMSIPVTAQTTEITAEHITTNRKLLKIRIADNAGKIISAEISREPTKFIAKTIITAIIIAISIL